MNSFQFKLRRVTLFGLFVIFTLIAINPVLRWAIVQAGCAVTGAGVEVDRVQASLISGQIAISGFRAADPQHRQRNLFDMGQVNLQLDRSRLLHRQFVVSRAEVSDLQLASERATGSALTESASADYLAEIRDRYARLGRNWLESTAEQLDSSTDLELTSIGLAEELLRRWPNELEGLEQRAIALRSDLIELNKQLKATGENPLRNALRYQAAISEIEHNSQQLAEIEAELNRVAQQILMDQDAVHRARENDLQLVVQPNTVDAIRPDALTEYLLGREVSDNIVSIIYWMRWGRQFLPTLSQEYPSARHRGRDVFFEGVTPDASIVIQDLLLRGAHGAGSGIQYEFEGRIQGLSSRPTVRAQPISFVAQTTTSTPCLVEATMRNEGRECQSRIRVNCPRLKVPSKTLGDERQLALELAPGNMHLWVELESQGDKLSGEVVLKRSGVTIASIVADEYKCSEIGAVFAGAAEKIQRIEARVDVSGTLDRPTWVIQSNLGTELSKNLQLAIADTLVLKQKTKLKSLNSETDQRISGMIQQLESKSEEVVDLLASGKDQLGQVRESIASRAALTDGLVEPTSPLRETL